MSNEVAPIPSGWRIRRVGDICQTINGHPFDAETFGPDGDVPLVRIRDLNSEQFETFVPEQTVPHRVMMRDGDLVIGMDGDFEAVLWRRGRAALNQRLCLLRPKRGHDIRFVSYALPEKLRVINDLTYATTVKHLSSGQVAAIRIPTPDFDEQRRIAEFLDRETAQIDELIAKQEQLISILAERKRVATDRLLLAGFGTGQASARPGAPWLGGVPADWRVVPLWAMFRREKRVGYPDEPMLSVFRDHGVVRKDDFENLNKTAENRNIYQLVEPGWLIVNRMKAWQGSVGVSTFRGIVSGHYLCFRPMHRESSAYLNMALRSSAYTRGYLALSRGVRPGQAEIDNDQFRATPIVLPHREEQERIVAAVSRLSKPIDELQGRATSAIALLRERRQALISAAVTGQIVTWEEHPDECSEATADDSDLLADR